jgi:hypothetical protein
VHAPDSNHYARLTRAKDHHMPTVSGNTQQAPVINAELISLTDLASLAAAGIAYPRTEWAWRNIFRNRHINGHRKSFRREGKRILVSVADYLAVQRSKVA